MSTTARVVKRSPGANVKKVRDHWVMDVQATITIEIEPEKPMSRRTAEAVALEEAARRIASDPQLLDIARTHHSHDRITIE